MPAGRRGGPPGAHHPLPLFCASARRRRSHYRRFPDSARASIALDRGPYLPQRGKSSPALAPSVAAGLSIRSLSTPTARTAATPRCGARSELGHEGVLRGWQVSAALSAGGAAFPDGGEMGSRRDTDGAPALPSSAKRRRVEPGTFKDRILNESDPFALVEAMTIAALTRNRLRAWPLSTVRSRVRPRMRFSIRVASHARTSCSSTTSWGRASHSTSSWRSAQVRTCAAKRPLVPSSNRKGLPREPRKNRRSRVEVACSANRRS